MPLLHSVEEGSNNTVTMEMIHINYHSQTSAVQQTVTLDNMDDDDDDDGDNEEKDFNQQILHLTENEFRHK